MKTKLLARWQANFLTGLAIVLPGVVSIGVVLWLFGTVANFTDKLLFFLPSRLTHSPEGPMYWHWSLAALVLAAFLIGTVGWLARYYLGKRLIEWVDTALLRIPLLNRIYGTIKQVNDAFSSTNKTSFRTVVLVEFPRAGMYSVGFLTSEQQGEIPARLGERIVCVFIPTTPNPTSGFLVLVPEEQVTKLDLSVADGIKYIISLGAIVPEHSQSRLGLTKPALGSAPGSRP